MAILLRRNPAQRLAIVENVLLFRPAILTILEKNDPIPQFFVCVSLGNLFELLLALFLLFMIMVMVMVRLIFVCIEPFA